MRWHGTNSLISLGPPRAHIGEANMYIVFLMTLISVLLIMTGRRGLGVAATLATVATTAVMLYLDMTTKLQISL